MKSLNFITRKQKKRYFTLKHIYSTHSLRNSSLFITSDTYLPFCANINTIIGKFCENLTIFQLFYTEPQALSVWRLPNYYTKWTNRKTTALLLPKMDFYCAHDPHEWWKGVVVMRCGSASSTNGIKRHVMVLERHRKNACRYTYSTRR